MFFSGLRRSHHQGEVLSHEESVNLRNDEIIAFFLALTFLVYHNFELEFFDRIEVLVPCNRTKSADFFDSLNI